jgi:hypothetical protein
MTLIIAAECLACSENKPVLPMTPHSKRQSKLRTPSRSNLNKHTFDEDLISWETPELRKFY